MELRSRGALRLEECARLRVGGGRGKEGTGEERRRQIREFFFAAHVTSPAAINHPFLVLFGPGCVVGLPRTTTATRNKFNSDLMKEINLGFAPAVVKGRCQHKTTAFRLVRPVSSNQRSPRCAALTGALTALMCLPAEG